MEYVKSSRWPNLSNACLIVKGIEVIMKFVLIFLILSFAGNAFAEMFCSPAIDQGQFESLVEETKNLYFPELKDITIGISKFHSNAYFLQAQPVIKTLVKKRRNRHYNIQLNTKLLDCPPSPKALEAILVHELEHIMDYHSLNLFEVTGHGVSYAASLKTRVSYERATDYKVLVKGLHIGLIEYREWVYQWLSPKELANKRLIYLTPEEIMADISAH